MRTRTIDVDINSNSLRILRYKQYDHNNILEVFVKKNKEILDLTSYTIRVFFILPNNTIIQKNATFKDRKIIIMIESVLLEQYGKIPVEITMSNGNEIVTIFRMYLEVEESIDRKSAIEGNPEWDIIKDGLSAIDDKVSHNELKENLENYYNKMEIDEKIINISTEREEVLNNYATKEDLPTKISDLENDKNYLTSIPNEYITEHELEERIKDIDVDIDLSAYATKEDLHGHMNKGILDKITNDKINEWDNKSTFNGDYNNLVNKPNIPSIEGLAFRTEIPTNVSQLINDKNYLTSIPSQYVTETELDRKVVDIIEGGEINLNGYAKKEDLNDKANNLFQSDMLTVSSLGGISAGTNLNNMSIQDILTKLLYPYVAPTISSSIVYSPTGGTYEFGQTVTVTQIKATVTKKSENITKVSFYRNGLLENSITSSVSNGGSFSYTFTNPISITSSISNSYFQAKVTDASGKVVSANTTALNFYYPYYYGVIGANVDITENLIKNLTKQVVSKGNKTYTYSPNYQRMVIAYPKSYGVLSSILDPNGFEQLSSFTCLEKSIVGLNGTSQQYYVYVNDASTNTNFKMSFYY